MTPTASGPGSEGCLDEIGLSRLLESEPYDQREAALTHLAGCGSCRTRLASLARLLSDPAVAAEVRRIETAYQATPWPRRIVAGAGLLATAALLLILVWPGADARRPSERHRGPVITASTVPAPIAPLGEVVSPASLNWNSVPGAELYRVTLFDAAGALLFESQLTDTSVAIPDSVVLAAERLYLWKVEARTGWERWTSSELVSFRPTGAAPQGHSIRNLGSDSLRQVARRVSDSALIAGIRSRPLEVRDAVNESLAQSVRGGSVEREAELRLAQRLATAYSAAWNDSFLLREVARFRAWPGSRQAARIAADSLRRAGTAAFSREGTGAALRIWRRALSRASAIPDTSGMAAVLGNIGAGLARENQLDSAERYLDRSRHLARAAGDIRVEANALAELAGVRASRSDIAGARQLYAGAIGLRHRIGDSRGLAADYNNLAGLARDAGDLDEARRQLEAALALNRRDGRSEAAATNLVNLGALAELAGQFGPGERYYREAIAIWRGGQAWADLADGLRGLAELELMRGDYSAARAALTEALQHYERTGPLNAAVETRERLAATHAAEGNLQPALDELRRAQQLSDSADIDPGVQARTTLARAELSALLNSRAEAERFYLTAERLSRRAGDRAGEAAAQEGLAQLLMEQGSTARARELLHRALRSRLESGDRRAAALTRLAVGDLSFRLDDTAGARKQLVRASDELARLGDPVASGAALGARASLELAAGFPVRAESLYRAGLRSVGDRVAPAVTWELHAGLGNLYRQQRAWDKGGRELTTAIADVQRAGRSLTLTERRSGFLSDKWEVYVQLALLERDRGAAGKAFAVSERARAGSMLELLTQGRVQAADPPAAELVAREQDLRRRINSLTDEVQQSGGGDPLLRGPEVSTSGAVVRESLLRAQEEYAALLLEVQERAPRHAALVAPDAVSWSDVARRLRADEALLEFLVSDAGSVVFVVTSDTIRAVGLEAGRRELARLVDFVRGTLQPRGTPALDSLWRAPLRQLHRDLIGPIEASGLLAGKRRLIIVPHAELHYLPFAALLADSRAQGFLAERFEVLVTPSASVWLTLGARHRTRATKGVLALAPQPDVLLASRGEVAATAKVSGRPSIMVGRAATEAAFRRESRTRRVIHLATSGVLNKQNPLFSFIQLAADDSHDGRLEVHEVFGLDLAADLIVLSACQTGLASGALADVPAGDDWVGLARAFLSAGASQVLATLWPVQDQATAALMEQFYQRYTVGGDAGRALAAAQRALLREASTAHPYYWAGFELIGGL